MGDWSLLEGQLLDTGGQVVASSKGTTVATSAVANTKGNWIQIYASTPFDSNGGLIFIDESGNSNKHLIDIGVGAVDGEVVLIPNLHISLRNNQIVPFCFPLTIPAGTRITARAQCHAGGVYNVFVSITLFASGFMPTEPLGRVTAYGANEADSGGTEVDSGLVAHTKGGYSEIDAATTNPIRAIVIAIGNNNNTSMTDCYWLADLAIGALGEEIIIVPDFRMGASTTSDVIVPATIGPIYIDIPAGTRLAGRAQCSIVNGTDRLFDIVVYGID